MENGCRYDVKVSPEEAQMAVIDVQLSKLADAVDRYEELTAKLGEIVCTRMPEAVTEPANGGECQQIYTIASELDLSIERLTACSNILEAINFRIQEQIGTKKVFAS